MNFKDLGLGDALLESISYLGFETPTPIQEQAIPIIMSGRDLIGCAQTGTGKTAAYLLPILNNISESSRETTNTLIIVPTRELAMQIDQQIDAIGYFAEIHSFAVYGGGVGRDWNEQKTALKHGADIIVATPGKLISHLNMGYVSMKEIRHLVLDEADRMLDMGFHDDMVKIISFLPKERQTMLFSATMPPKIRQLSKKILKDPAEINLALSKPAEGVLQIAYLIYDRQKIPLIHKLLSDKPNYNSILIFCSTRKKVSQITISLRRNGFDAKEISSDLEQSKREEVLKSFKSKQTRILVATDVLSRGIDIKDIQLIINFDTPQDEEDYVHRVGRTARAESTGLAITFINEEDMRRFANIERLIETEVMKLDPPPEIGKGPKWTTRSIRRSGRR